MKTGSRDRRAQGGSYSAADRMAARRVLISLNSRTDLSRDVLCRLGNGIDQWLNQPVNEEEAEAIGVSAAHLDLARMVADQTLTGTGPSRPDSNDIEGQLADKGIQIVTCLDDGYPPNLRDLELPPPVLYLRGALGVRPAISIVGPRHPDPWALEVARQFSRSLAAAGLVIVSGLARGVDQAAHQAAVEAPGITQAVLGCGVDIDYPRGSARLRRAIEERGALISEFPPGCTPRPHHFPIRNRLIAALGFATLVVQADLKSGSLITARLALELGRDVLAAPGRPFDRKSRGSNALLMDGAQIALDPKHLLEALSTPIRRQLEAVDKDSPAGPGATTPDPSSQPTGVPSRLEAEIASAVAAEAKTPEQLARELGRSMVELLPLLTQLELSGELRLCAGGRYIRAR